MIFYLASKCPWKKKRLTWTTREKLPRVEQTLIFRNKNDNTVVAATIIILVFPMLHNPEDSQALCIKFRVDPFFAPDIHYNFMMTLVLLLDALSHSFLFQWNTPLSIHLVIHYEWNYGAKGVHIIHFVCTHTRERKIVIKNLQKGKASSRRSPVDHLCCLCSLPNYFFLGSFML